jgi:hypothetical protein
MFLTTLNRFDEHIHRIVKTKAVEGTLVNVVNVSVLLKSYNMFVCFTVLSQRNSKWKLGEVK